MKMQWTRDAVMRWIKSGEGCPPPVSGGKGNKVAQQTEHQQYSFTQQLEQLFAGQFAQQSQVLSYLRNAMTAKVENPQGYAPDTLAALRTNADESVARNVAQAKQAAQMQTAAHGGSTLPSGVQAQIEAGIDTAGAGMRSQEQERIAAENEQLKQANQWQAVNALENVSAQEGAASGQLIGGSNQAAGTISDAANANTQANASSFGGQFMGALGSGLGKLLTGQTAIGGGKGFAGLGCWIVAELYDDWGPITLRTRAYMAAHAGDSWKNVFGVAAYILFGRMAAFAIRKSRTLRRLAHKLFDPIVEKANGTLQAGSRS